MLFMLPFPPFFSLALPPAHPPLSHLSFTYPVPSLLSCLSAAAPLFVSLTCLLHRGNTPKMESLPKHITYINTLLLFCGSQLIGSVTVPRRKEFLECVPESLHHVRLSDYGESDETRGTLSANLWRSGKAWQGDPACTCCLCIGVHLVSIRKRLI